MNTDNKEIKKWNTKLVTPMIVLFCTSIIAVFAYFKHYPVGEWFIIVFTCVIIFLVLGLIIEKMISTFVDMNYKKAMAEKAEIERQEELRRAAIEAAGENLGIIRDDGLKSDDM